MKTTTTTTTKMTSLTYTVSFKTTQARPFFQNDDFSISMYFQWEGGYHPRTR